MAAGLGERSCGAGPSWGGAKANGHCTVRPAARKFRSINTPSHSASSLTTSAEAKGHFLKYDKVHECDKISEFIIVLQQTTPDVAVADASAMLLQVEWAGR